MAITPEQVGEAVVKAIPGFFNDAIDQLRQGEGAYLRDGEPEGIVGQIGQAVGRSACRQYAAQGPDAVGSKGERFERACRPYLNSLNPGEGAGFEVPFRGGQCDGQFYIVTFDVFNPTNQTTQTLSYVVAGPMSSARLQTNPGVTQQSIVFTARGAVSSITCANPPQVGDLREFRIGSFPSNRTGGAVASIAPCGGFTDNCGNPPAEVIPPTLRPDPMPPPFPFNPFPGLDVDIDVDLQPDGTINVDFGGGPENVDPFPEDEPGGGEPGGDGDPGDPTDPGSPGGGGDTGDGGNEEGEAGPEEELVGLLVEVIGFPANANRFENNSAQPFRGIGYVRMGYPGRLGIDISGGTVISPQFFHAPQRGLTDWKVDANVGFNLRVTPYYREISE